MGAGEARRGFLKTILWHKHFFQSCFVQYGNDLATGSYLNLNELKLNSILKSISSVEPVTFPVLNNHMCLGLPHWIAQTQNIYVTVGQCWCRKRKPWREACSEAGFHDPRKRAPSLGGWEYTMLCSTRHIFPPLINGITCSEYCFSKQVDAIKEILVATLSLQFMFFYNILWVFINLWIICFIFYDVYVVVQDVCPKGPLIRVGRVEEWGKWMRQSLPFFPCTWGKRGEKESSAACQHWFLEMWGGHLMLC